MALATWAVVVLVLLLVLVLLVVKVTRGSTTIVAPPVTPAPPEVVRAVTTLPASVFDAADPPPLQGPAAPLVLPGGPVLSAGGHPVVVYIGAEFCPFCAAERWALVAALGRFGTFDRLGATTSSATEIFPGIRTFTFDGATYLSTLVTFSAVEEYGDVPSARAPGGYVRLHELSPLQQEVLHRFAPGLPAGAGSLPVVDVANRLVVSGAAIGFSPAVLQGLSMSQIAAKLTDPSSTVAQQVLGAADMLSAAICAATGEQPATVCRSSGVTRAAERLGLPTAPGSPAG